MNHTSAHIGIDKLTEIYVSMGLTPPGPAAAKAVAAEAPPRS